MKFTIQNEITANYLANYKPFQLKTIVVSANGYQHGFCEPFLSLIDSGAKFTSISSKRMNLILPHILDANGEPLQPVTSIKSKGVYGKTQDSPVYILPHLYIDKIHLTDVVVSVPETNNYDCLIGRSILHQCVATYDPEFDVMHFEFKDTLKPDKQKINGINTFGDVNLFAMFGDESDLIGHKQSDEFEISTNF